MSDRYVVSELEGWSGRSAGGGSGGKRKPGLYVAVHDRAYCWRVVKSFTTETMGSGSAKGIDRRQVVRQRAADLADSLNRAAAL